MYNNLSMWQQMTSIPPTQSRLRLYKVIGMVTQYNPLDSIQNAIALQWIILLSICDLYVVVLCTNLRPQENLTWLDAIGSNFELFIIYLYLTQSYQ